MTVKTKDTYEAAYYYMCGAKFVSVTSRMLPPNKIKKKGFQTEWTITMSDVPPQLVAFWNTDQAYVSLRRFENARRRMKRMILDSL